MASARVLPGFAPDAGSYRSRIFLCRKGKARHRFRHRLRLVGRLHAAGCRLYGAIRLRVLNAGCRMRCFGQMKIAFCEGRL
jgi:hypothetical protein